MLSIIFGSIGLVVSFSGAFLLALSSVKKEEEIVEESKLLAPVGHPGSEQYIKSIRRMPHVQALFKQSKKVRSGLWILTIGFAFQIIGASFSWCQ